MSESLLFWLLYDIPRSDGLLCLSNKINTRETFLLCGIFRKKNTEKKKEETYGPEQWDLDEKVPLDTREIMKKKVVNFFFWQGRVKKDQDEEVEKKHYTFTKKLQCL